jgi:hypothetical protein
MSNHNLQQNGVDLKNARRGSLINIIDVIKQQDASKGELLAKSMWGSDRKRGRRGGRERSVWGEWEGEDVYA